MDERTDALRENALRLLAEGLEVDWDSVRAVGDAWAALQAERDAEAARMFAYVDSQMPRITAELTRDFLRPALAAAGFDGDVAERYEVAWERAPYCGGFNPGMFAQEGVEYGRCPESSCPPWPEADA